jgi:hypothetical protein
MLPARFLALRTAFALLAVVCLTLAPRAADPVPVPTTPPTETLAQALEGVWVRVGEPGDVRPPPATGGAFKFRMSNRWVYTQADPATGVVKAHFGGTYRVRGNEYAEKIEYSTDPDDSELGSTLKFTVKIEGDLMTQTGVDNPYTEVWQRVR